MIKRRELHECGHLFEYLSHPSVFPYVRQKANSAEEFMFMTKQLMEEEERGEVISRTITDDYGQPIGTINLYDIQDQAGFLGTWIGQPFQGKGFNQKAKNLFLEELFYQHNINTVFLRINAKNEKSIRAAEKLAYTMKANDTHPVLLAEINSGVPQYELYQIPKDLFYLSTAAARFAEEEEQAM
ncbi:MAG: GNAT family protein [Planococcaceae bacterium]|uniref:GNAT family N-acetyltransferase n=1 Tax=Paenisporosarcina quisquiliarum TaxID=365346 RepID=UPI0024210D3F|nr:GNAT family N-acetyltransferase [Bacillota bacterium]MDX1771426.1 GNAT family protein [Planococcaceae bacterium]